MKTLKDIEIRKIATRTYCFSDELKQEAIKWIKNWNQINKKDNANMIYAFENFFNITEEDLK